MENQPINDLAKPDYYTSVGKKVWDFFMGFFGALAVFFGALYLASSVFSGSLLYYLILTLVAIIAVAWFFHVGRRFVSIGITSTVLIPLLIFGGCLLMLSGGRF